MTNKFGSLSKKCNVIDYEIYKILTNVYVKYYNASILGS